MGNTSNHTPAPWACFNDHPNPDTAESLTHIRAVAAGSEPRWMRKDIADIYGCTNPEQLANAHLIAAAPDMLAVCEESYQLVTLLLDIASVELEMDLVELLGDNLAKAIRKAKGGADE